MSETRVEAFVFGDFITSQRFADFFGDGFGDDLLGMFECNYRDRLILLVFLVAFLILLVGWAAVVG